MGRGTYPTNLLHPHRDRSFGLGSEWLLPKSSLIIARDMFQRPSERETCSPSHVSFLSSDEKSHLADLLAYLKSLSTLYRVKSLNLEMYSPLLLGISAISVLIPTHFYRVDKCLGQGGKKPLWGVSEPPWIGKLFRVTPKSPLNAWPKGLLKRFSSSKALLHPS